MVTGGSAEWVTLIACYIIQLAMLLSAFLWPILIGSFGRDSMKEKPVTNQSS